ncbi:MAG: hypothetical protein HQ564_09315 [Candidatus Saganbacteria bacterium]|nr:hypothetical protein [Candidatus Saganbacteria bacterium]
MLNLKLISFDFVVVHPDIGVLDDLLHVLSYLQSDADKDILRVAIQIRQMVGLPIAKVLIEKRIKTGAILSILESYFAPQVLFSLLIERNSFSLGEDRCESLKKSIESFVQYGIISNRDMEEILRIISVRKQERILSGSSMHSYQLTDSGLTIVFQFRAKDGLTKPHMEIVRTKMRDDEEGILYSHVYEKKGD